MFVQHQQIQLCQRPANRVEKIATSNKRSENCGKVKAGDELGFEDCGKLFYSAEFERIKSSGDAQSTQSARFESHNKLQRKLPLEVHKIRTTPRRVLKCSKEMQR